MEPLHEWLRAVCSDRASGPIRQAAVRLTHIGHSTGWDLLAGAVTGLLPVFHGTPVEVGGKADRKAGRVVGQGARAGAAGVTIVPGRESDGHQRVDPKG